MRKISLNIQKLGLVVGNTVDIKLVDSVGKLTTSPSGYMFDKTLTLASDTLEVELLENENIPHKTHYNLKLSSGLSFNFILPTSSNQKPHELTSLFGIACNEWLIDKNTNKLNDEFIQKLDIYFSGENPHLGAAQKDLVRLYEQYADEVIETSATIDIVRMVDEYLATLTGEKKDGN